MSASVSFVCCVESGWLEAQTVRLVESMRRHGGRYAQAPIFAVTPRFGPPLSRQMHAFFERHNVRYIRKAFATTRYSWFKFINKPLAVVAAEEQADTDVVCWLYGDLLILSEPSGLELDDVDFAASASDKEMGSTGPGDPFENLWGALCKTVGVGLDELPWVTTELDQFRIRAYWNGGFFAYRRATRFGHHYLSMCEKLLDARVGSGASGYSPGINEMSAIAFAMVKQGLRYRALPFPYNYPLGVRTPPAWYSPERFAQVKILHYHDSMWPKFWPTLIERLRAVHPHVAEWVAPLGPMENHAPLPYRLLDRGLRKLRTRQEKVYKASCQLV